jgi:phage tail sheath protein FI
MVNFTSPGVYVVEKDNSNYPVAINSSVVGIVGFASKGPINVATLITSQNQLIDTFGAPSEDIIGQGLEGALEILETTNTVYFVRASDDDTAVDASAGIVIGSCPSLVVSGNTYGVDGGTDLYLKIQSYNNAGVAQYATPKKFAIPAGTVESGSTQAAALRSVIGGSLDPDHVGVFDGPSTASGVIVGSYAGSGASLAVSAYSNSTYTTGVSALMGTDSSATGNSDYGMSATTPALAASSTRVYGSTYVNTGASSVSYIAESLYPGAGYNGGTKSDGTLSGLRVQTRNVGGQNFFIDVLDDGVLSESFKASFVGSGVFIEDVINTGAIDIKTKDLKGNLYAAGLDATATKLTTFAGTAASLFGVAEFSVHDGLLGFNAAGTSNTTGTRWVKPVDSITSLANGTNGIAGTATLRATDLIGDSSEEPKTGMQALDDLTLNIGIALVPGIYTESVQNALVTLAEKTTDFLVLLAPPVAVGNSAAAIDWTNGKSGSTAGSRSTSIISSYAAVYYPHLKVFSIHDGKDIWYDPTIFAARQMAHTDNVSDSWFAPAGFVRGKLSKPSEVEVKLNQGDRDSLYSGGNIINPIASFPQQGITIFGQRTAQRTSTALDRINVRRLMIYIKKVALASAQRIVFEPNDEFTWAQVEALVNPFLDDIKRRRGITEFRVVCDNTTNTPVRVDRNELWCKVLLKPTKTAEVIVFELNLTNQSANLGNL